MFFILYNVQILAECFFLLPAALHGGGLLLCELFTHISFTCYIVVAFYDALSCIRLPFQLWTVSSHLAVPLLQLSAVCCECPQIKRDF